MTAGGGVNHAGLQASLLDPFKPYISEILQEHSCYNGVLLFERLKVRGYGGQISILRDTMAKIRKQIVTTSVRHFETEPGPLAQADWKEFGGQIVDGKEQNQKTSAAVQTLWRRTER